MIARRRVRGGVCDVRTRPQTRAMKLPALRYLICSPAVGAAASEERQPPSVAVAHRDAALATPG